MGHFPRFLRLISPIAGAALLFQLSTLPSAAQAAASLVVVPASDPAVTAEPAARQRLSATWGKLPISFEANQGQAGHGVSFLAHGSDFSVYLLPGAAVLSIQAPAASAAKLGSNPRRPAAGSHPLSSALALRLVGANLDSKASGQDRLPGNANYFIGSDPSAWHTDVPTYSRVRFPSVYPGIDLVYYGNQSGTLEHDFVVASGADPAAIAIKLIGLAHPAQLANGDLHLKTPAGEIALHAPVAYQQIDGRRHTIPARYEIADNVVRFHLGAWDHTAPLIIDPVITHTAILGGSNTDNSSSIAVDSQSNAYITGQTYSTDFPLENPYQSTWTPNGSSATAAFVSKINPSGTALVYSTYLGGPFSSGTQIVVDGSGRAYVAGLAGSGFPLKNAYQSTYGGGESDAFVTELSYQGNSLIFSTYLGGPQFDYATALARDSSGNIYITGRTDGSFPALHSFETEGTPGVFVAKFNSAGALQYSSMYGNIEGQSTSIAADSTGAAYIAGYTNAPDIPETSNPTYLRTCTASECGFAAKFNPTGESLAYSTYLGSTDGGGYSIALDSSLDLYIAGASGAGLPVSSSAFQKTFGGGEWDGFVEKLNPNGSALIWSTYLGGNGDDVIYGLALDQNRTVYVSGWTCSTNFPLQASVQPLSRTADRPCQLFVATLNGSLSSIDYYSTYIGTATYSNQGNYLAIDKSLNVYLTGYDSGNVQATHGAINTGTAASASAFHVFASKLDIEDDLSINITTTPSIPHPGGLLTYFITITSLGPDFGTNVMMSDTLPPGTLFSSTSADACTTPAQGGTGTVTCKLLQLNKGSSWTVSVTVEVTANNGTYLTDTATTWSSMQDFTLNNNTATNTVPVEATP